ncbi:MAG TPA: 16S rRNA (cytidine(1402)-2'-O)-methyltransferase [Chloroflexota bacterium]|nr:16S rRNA (cytidine(1402)-2'-O)-methyltransferase [Chloroflexota bacterium]
MGTLYVVATPIGNLEDVTLRAIRVLREVDLIAAEDTRVTRRLLAHHGIQTRLTSFFEHTRLRKLDWLLGILSDQDVALVSDAGTPSISDPGYELVRGAIKNGVEVVPVPGPSAVVTALVGSGLPTDQFTYFGFLPRQAGERRRVLQSFASEPRTLVGYEAPHRLAASLADALQVLGNREAVVARELTKLHEEFRRGDLFSLSTYFTSTPARGECTLVIAGMSQTFTPVEPGELESALRTALADGLRPRDAIARVVRETGKSRRVVYQAHLAIRD